MRLHQFRYATVSGQDTLDHEVFSINGHDALRVQVGRIEIGLVSYE
jgi:hypothetical protein